MSNNQQDVLLNTIRYLLRRIGDLESEARMKEFVFGTMANVETERFGPDGRCAAASPFSCATCHADFATIAEGDAHKCPGEKCPHCLCLRESQIHRPINYAMSLLCGTVQERWIAENRQ